MSRRIKKGPYIDEKLMKKVKNSKPGGAAIKTWSRSATITPEMIGYSFGVHNGKEHIVVQVTEDLVGHMLGELSPTAKFIRLGGKMQREIEKSKK